MKRSFLFITLTVVLLLNNITIHAEQWNLLSGIKYNSINLRSSDDAYISAGYNQMIHITDNCTKFEFINDSNQIKNIMNTFFLDTLTAWQVNTEGNLLYSVDGAKTWTQIFSFMESFGYNPNLLQFLDNNIGFAICVGKDTSYFFKTIDGGETWEKTENYFKFPIKYFKMFNQNEGVVVATNGAVWESIDGGNNWNISGMMPSAYKSVSFKDRHTSVNCDTYNIFKTIDGGKNWQIKLNSSYYIHQVSFVDDNTVFAVCSRGLVFKSTDQGESWSCVKDTNFNHWYYSMKFIDKNNGFVAGNPGVILRTTNGGNTWDTLQNEIYFHSKAITFIDEKTGFMTGDYHQSTYFYFISKTTDAGLTWQTIFAENNFYFPLEITFVDKAHGWINADKGLILRTTDGGKNWLKNIINAKSNVSCLSFIDKDLGYAACDSFYRTTNGGETWQTLSDTVSNKRPTSIFFLNKKIGWRTFYIVYKIEEIPSKYTILNYCQLYIQKTTNGGKQWTTLSIDSTINKTYGLMRFADENCGWLQFGRDSIMKTTDGGKTWKSVIIEPYFLMWNFKFANKSKGWAVGENGLIFYTTDGGDTWLKQNVNRKNNIFSGIGIVNDSVVYVCGDFGTILRYSDSILDMNKINTSVIFPEHPVDSISNKECLYPNPATEFIYLPKEISNQNIEIELYSLIGQKLLHFPATSDAINISNLPKGIYFIKFENTLKWFVKI